MRDLLDDTELHAELMTLEGWKGDRSSISREVHLQQAEVDGFLIDLETIARELDHDPDVDLSDGDLVITMSTHSAGGVTELDIAYARRVEELLRSLHE